MANQILAGEDFRHRRRHRGFEPSRGQPHRAVVDERHNGERAEGGKENPMLKYVADSIMQKPSVWRPEQTPALWPGGQPALF
jgi:hypothetical protein